MYICIYIMRIFTNSSSADPAYVRHQNFALQWRHNGRDGVPNHQPRDCLLKRLFRRRSQKTSKLRVTGLCAGNSPVTGEFPAQMASNTENVSIWWRHHGHHCVCRCPDLAMSPAWHRVEQNLDKILSKFLLLSIISYNFLMTRRHHSKWPPRSREISRHLNN